MTFLSENRDVFAWNYTEISGLDPDVAVHRLSVDPAKKPVKRRFRPELLPKIDKLRNFSHTDESLSKKVQIGEYIATFALSMCTRSGILMPGTTLRKLLEKSGCSNS